MKQFISIKAVISMFVVLIFLISGCNHKNPKDFKGNISISATSAFLPLANVLAKEFQKKYSEVKINIISINSDAETNNLLSENSKFLITSTYSNGGKAFSLPIAKDAIIAITNTDNPNLDNLLNNGLNKATLENIYINGSMKHWINLKNETENNEIKIFKQAENTSISETWAKLFNKTSKDLKGNVVIGESNLLDSVRKNKNSIAYINYNFVYNHTTNIETEGIHVIPFDKNGNGMIDDNENFYFKLDSIKKGIFSNRYPDPLAFDIVLLSKDANDELTKEFYKWILTDGQQFIKEIGLIGIDENKDKENLKKIQN